MCKPWDALRVPPPKKQPICTGGFYCGPHFEIISINAGAVDMRIGPDRNADVRFQADQLRLAGQFFTELADQLERRRTV